MPEPLGPREHLISADDRLLLTSVCPKLIKALALESSALLAELVAKGVITQQQKNFILAEKVEEIQVQILVNLLLKGKHNTVDLLIEALRDSGQEHVADQLCEERQKCSQRAVEVADGGSGVEEATQGATTSSKKNGGAKQMECLRELPEGLLYRFSVLYNEKDDVVSVPFATYMTNQLEAAGWTPGYCASRDRLLGSSKISANMDMIQCSQFIICVMTDTFLNRGWDRNFNEASFGDVWDDTKNERYRCVVPVLLHDNRQAIEDLLSQKAKHLAIIERYHVGVRSFVNKDCELGNMLDRVKRTMKEYSQRYRPPHRDNAETTAEEGVYVSEEDGEASKTSPSTSKPMQLVSPLSLSPSPSPLPEPSSLEVQQGNSVKLTEQILKIFTIVPQAVLNFFSLVIPQIMDYINEEG